MRSSRTISLAALSLLCYWCCLDSSRNSALGFLSSSKATRSIIVPSSNSVLQSNSNEHPQSHRRRRCRLPRPFSNHIVLHAASNDKDTPASGLPSSSSSSSSSQSSNTTISVAGATGTGDASASIEVPDTSALPSYRKLIVFTLTTILIWISEPLLSLVDTTIVGMTTTSAKSAVVQIAALGPATTLYDSSIYMTYFLAIAATNLISPALAKKDWKQLRKSTSHLMGLAIVFGSIVSLVAFGLGKSLIANMVGTSFVNPEIIPLATNYARIRAAVAPFCVVDFVAQSFCLATLDTKTPAMAVAVASLVNIVGDLLLSPRWGIQGAAVATAMATVSSSLILVRKVRQQTKQWKILQETEEQDQYVFLQKSKTKTKTKTTIAEMTTENDSDDSSSSPRPLKTQVVNGSIEMVDDNQDRPFGAPKTKKINGAAAPKEIPFWSLPDKKSLVELMKLAGPIFFVMMGKIACYSIMTVRATTFGIIPLAAHNIMMRIFFFFACFGDSLSQATQTFFPQVKQEKRGQLIQRLLYLSAGVGFGISQCSYFILTKLGGFLTKDAAIIQQMAQYAPYVAGSVLLHPFIMLLEGTVLARRDLMYLVGMYITTMALHFGMVFLLPQSFGGLWQVFFTFQAIRLVQFAGRVAWKSSSSSRRGGGGGGAGGEPNQLSGDTAAADVP